MFSFDPYSWLLNFGINTAMGKDPMTSAKNATIGQGVGNLLGNIVPADLFPTEVAGNTVTQASQNLPQAMISQDTLNQGILNTMGDASSIGGANLMSAARGVGGGSAGMIPNTVDTANLPLAMTPNAPLNTTQSLMPSYMDTTGKTFDQSFGYVPGPGGMEQFPSVRGYNEFPLTARNDIPQVGDFNIGADMGSVIKSTPEEIASRAGGYEEEPLYKTAYNKVANYIEENPLEAGMYGLIGGSALYSGLNPRQQRVPLTQVTSSVKQATAPQFGSPLKIRRPGMRG